MFESHRVRTPHLTPIRVTFATFLYSSSPIPQPPQTCYACDWTTSNIITRHQELWFSEDRCPCGSCDDALPVPPPPKREEGVSMPPGPQNPATTSLFTMRTPSSSSRPHLSSAPPVTARPSALPRPPCRAVLSPGVSNNRPAPDKPLDAPPSSAIIARPRTCAHAR